MKFNHPTRKLFSILLCLCMLLQCAPISALAADAASDNLCVHHTAHTAECLDAENGSDCTYACQICHVQNLVDALPAEITAENAEAVKVQLTAIDTARAVMSDAESAQVDFSKYSAAISAINVLEGMPNAEIPVPAMEIFVKLFDSTTQSEKTFTLETEPNETIATLKEKLYAQDASLLPEMLSLLFAGTPLEDSKTLSDYNIQKESTLHLILKRTITVTPSENGTVTAIQYAASGETVTLTITPAEGYVTDTLTVTDTDGGAVTVAEDNTFTMPASDVIVSAIFKACTHESYKDNKCEICGIVCTHADTFDSATGKCSACQAELAQASTTVNGVVTYYETLAAAVDAMAGINEADAKVTLLADTDLTDDITVRSSSFTLDLNGKTINQTVNGIPALIINGHVTITGGGKISNPTPNGVAVNLNSGSLIVENCTIVGGETGLVIGGDAEIRGSATIQGTARAVRCSGNVKLIGAPTLTSDNHSIDVYSGTVDLTEISYDGYTLYAGTALNDENVLLSESYGMYRLVSGMYMSASTVDERAVAYIRCSHEGSAHTTATDNGDGTHSYNCSFCNTPLAQSHTTTAEATCAAKALCAFCGEYGEVDTDNHASENYTYTNNGDGTHTKVHECGVTVGEPENHSFDSVTHICICQAVEHFALNADSDVDGSFETPYSVPFGADMVDALRTLTPEKTGHECKGWEFYSDEECTLPISGSTMPGQAAYAKPIFEPIQYSITWILNGCTINSYIGKALPQTLPYNGHTGQPHQIKVVLDSPEGYYLQGFKDGNGDKLEYDTANGWLFLTVTGDMTMEAIVEPIPYTITWDDRDGSTYDVSVKYGEVITVPDSDFFVNTFINKAGYNFVGWEGYTEGMTMPNKDITIKANWHIKTPTLEESSGVYNGNAHTPTVYVGVLTEGEHYTVVYPDDMTTVGEKVITVFGKLGGSDTVIYTIEKAPAPAIQFPTVLNQITYGNKLEDAVLSFYENEYGTFRWTAPYGVPNSSGNYAIDFYPEDLQNYDWASSNRWIADRNALCRMGFVIVNKANGVGSVTMEGWTYGEAAKNPVPVSETNGINAVTYLYKAKGANDSTYTAEKPVNAGEYTVQATFASTDLYVDAVATADFTIAKAPLTITAKDNTIVYGDVPVADGITYSGFVGIEEPDVLGGELTYSYNYEQYGNIGTYTITPSGLTSGNYEITFKTGELTVTPKSITVTTDAINKIYGDEDPKLTYQVSGMVNNEKLTGELTRESGEDAGTYNITQGTLQADSNYSISRFVGSTLTIHPKNITVDDVKLGDALTYNGKQQTQTITVADGISYSVSGNKAADAGDYELTVTAKGNHSGSVTLDWSIAKAKLTITADDKIIYLGEALPELTCSVVGLLEGDALKKAPLLTTDTDLEKAGSYLITAADADAGSNYEVSYVSGKLIIMDGNTEMDFRIVLTELTKVPDGLKNTKFNTVDAIKAALIDRMQTEAAEYGEDNTVHYDVTLQFSLDGGKTWMDATDKTYPTEGTTVVLPYPEGTDAKEYDFLVSHMFTVTSQRLDTVAGEIELPAVTETEDGLQVTLNGLSPVTVAAKYHDHEGGTANCADKAICTVCEQAYGELDSTKHTGEAELKNAKNETCGADGYTGDIVCKGCGEVLTKGEAIKATGKHVYGSWTVVKAATKTEKGLKQHTCGVCGHVEYKDIPVLTGIPATGDSLNVVLYGALFIGSIAALLVLFLLAAKRRNH